MSTKVVVSLLGVLLMGAATVRAETPAAREALCPGKSRALVLGGGGVRGVYQVGAAWYLVNALDCTFDHVFGTSTGAVSAALLAQAKTLEELKRRVESLRADYEGLTRRSGLVRDRFLGLPRLLLPRWLGGLDGMATLAPVERRLRAQLGQRPVPTGNLTIPVVSLQAGALNPRVYRADDLIDLVIGSASIPVAIEPRRARLWVRATPQALIGSVLRVSVAGVPGLRDPNCQLRLSGARVLACQQLKTKLHVRAFSRSSDTGLRASRDEQRIIATTDLKLPTMTREDAQLIAQVIAQAQPDRPAPFEFTTVHQLVDGGVAEHVPLISAIRQIGEQRQLDFLVVLLTGRSPDTGIDREVRGGAQVGKASFSRLWDTYEHAAFQAPMGGVFQEASICESVALRRKLVDWYREFQQAVEPSTLQEIQTSMKRPFPVEAPSDPEWVERVSADCAKARWRPWRGWIIDPAGGELKRPLDVKPAQIRAALHQGCLEAAKVAGDYFSKQGGRDLSGVDLERSFGESACLPLAPPMRPGR